jgi:hypothetical protein
MDTKTRARLVKRAFELCKNGTWAEQRALATELVVEHGADGNRAFVEGYERAFATGAPDRDGWFDLHAPPEGCTWRAKAGTSPEAIVAKVWARLEGLS